MFDLAFVILPFDGGDPGEAIRASLARYQRGSAGEIPDEWLAFDDETQYVREVYESESTFSRIASGGLSIKGPDHAAWVIDGARVAAEMDRRGSTTWSIRFADQMDLDAFHDSFGARSRRDLKTGRYGRWLNSLGRWDWWDLGGRFDGWLIGERDGSSGRPISRISSGYSRGRHVLANIENVVGDAVGQEPHETVDLRADRNIELASTVLDILRVDRERQIAGSVVLPPSSVDDRLRWISAAPLRDPTETSVWLGLAPDAPWADVVDASLERFSDHWVAGVAYHF